MSLIEELEQIEEISIRLMGICSQLAINHVDQNRFIAETIYGLARQEQRTIKRISALLTSLDASDVNQGAYEDALYIMNIYKGIDRNKQRM